MKKLKNIALLLLLSVSAVVGVGTVKAEGFTIDQSLEIICNPAAIAKGQTTECYMIARPQASNESSASLHGFVSTVFTTKELTIEAANINDKIMNTHAAMTKPTTLNGAGRINGDNMPDELKDTQCIMDDNWITNAGLAEKTASDFACALFYTDKGKDNAYTPSSIRSNTALNQRVIPNYTNYGIIGSYTVKLKDDATTTGDCGSVCVKAWGATDVTKYATINPSTTTPGSEDTMRTNICVELHKENSSENPHPGHTPETGAFTSYAVLAAGALIAIGAIAIAKKNNRFNKI